jgi:hypothetical protein
VTADRGLYELLPVRRAVVRDAEASWEAAMRIFNMASIRWGRRKVRALYNIPCFFIDDGILAARRDREPIVETPSEMVRRGVYGQLGCQLRVESL